MRVLFVASVVVSCLSCGASGGSGGAGAAAGAAGSSSGAAGAPASTAASASAGGAGANSGEIGEPCASNADCTAVPGAECYTTIGGGPVPEVHFPNGFCSKACDVQSSDKECGEKAGCASIGQSGGRISTSLTICTPPCASDAECRASEGYKCFQLIPGVGVCVPP